MSSEQIETASSPDGSTAGPPNGRHMGLVDALSGARGPRQARFAQLPQGDRAIQRGADRGAARASSRDETAAAQT
eukprot:800438-Pyramimonas_sp.AAC.1